MKPVFRSCALTCAASMLAVLAACAPKVLPATSHLPSEPAGITLLNAQPSKYEDLGLVTLSEGVAYGDGFTADHVVLALRQQAAAKGANALLLTLPPAPNTKPDPDQVEVGAKFQNKWYRFTIKQTPQPTVVAKAIFVRAD